MFENIGDPELFPKAFAALSRHGRLVTAGGHGGGIVPLDVNQLYHNQITIIGATGETHERRAASAWRPPRADASGAVIDRVLPAVASGAGARDRRRARSGIGKVVLDATRI